MIGLLVLAAFFGVIVIMLFARREGVTMREGDYPSPLPTPAPTVAPTARPQKSAPTPTPSVVPSFAPTATPSGKPSPAPSAEPTAAASVATQSGVQRRSADDDATGLDDAFSMSGRGGGNMTVLSADDDDDDDSSGKEWAGSHNATDVWVSAFVVDDEDDDSGAIPKTTKMSLVTNLRVLVRVPGFTSETLTAAVQYAPHNTTLPALWSAATDLVCSEGDAKVELSLFRLRPHTEYTANVYFCAVDGDTRNSSINRCSSSSETWLSSSAASVAEVKFKTGRTGVPRFDDGPLARVERVHAFETPGWDMVTFAYNVDVESSSSSSTPLDNSAGSAARTHFDGVVAIDAEGWVVWYYHLRSTVGWDFLPYASDGTGGGIVLMSDSLKQSLTWKTYDDADDDDDDSRAASTRHDDALLAVRSTPTTHHWLANSQLQHVTPYGELESQFVQGCTGAALNYNQLSHELRLDHTSADLDGLVIRQNARAYPNVTITWEGSAKTRHTHVDALLGSAVMRWRRHAGSSGDADSDGGVLEQLYDLFDYAAPDTQPAALPSGISSWTWETAGCSGNTSDGREFLDYHHASSASSGPDGNVLVASRNLNTIWSFHANGSGLQWMISSSLDCSHRAERGCFSFVHDADMFYAPHSVAQLNGSTLLLLDDGNNRPGCAHFTDYAGCWSRAIMYRLDFDTMVARLAWQFEAPFRLPNDDSSIFSKSVWRHVMTHDEYNFDGGSVHALESDRLLVGFTATFSSRAYNRNASDLIWEVDPALPDAESIKSVLVVPRSGQDTSEGLWRAVPWRTIFGESKNCPL